MLLKFKSTLKRILAPLSPYHPLAPAANLTLLFYAPCSRILYIGRDFCLLLVLRIMVIITYLMVLDISTQVLANSQ
jgi:hypothetical protein